MKIDKDGSFSIEGDPRILYSTMLKVRVQIANTCQKAMATALTIAIRYSIVRRQFKNISG